MQVLKALWNTEDNEAWNQIKRRLHISNIKDTPSTNTSVTSGIAQELLQPSSSIVILNCGTRDTRAQAYKKDGTGVVRVLGEDKKPRGSFSSLVIGDVYQPKDEITGITVAQLRELVKKGLPEFVKDHKPSQGVVAVITGTVRNAWESASKEDKKIFEATVADVLKPLGVKPFGKSFFLSQTQEGQFEYNATCNLISGVEPNSQVLMSFGIGMGSAQLATKNTTIPFSFGMQHPERILGDSEGCLQQTIKEQLLGNEGLLQDLLAKVLDCDKPILALKSGCLIAVSRSFELLRATVLDCAPSEEKLHADVVFAPEQYVCHLQHSRAQRSQLSNPPARYFAVCAAPAGYFSVAAEPLDSATCPQHEALPGELILELAQGARKVQSLKRKAERDNDSQKLQSVAECDAIQADLNSRVEKTRQSLAAALKQTLTCGLVYIKLGKHGQKNGK